MRKHNKDLLAMRVRVLDYLRAFDVSQLRDAITHAKHNNFRITKRNFRIANVMRKSSAKIFQVERNLVFAILDFTVNPEYVRPSLWIGRRINLKTIRLSLPLPPPKKGNTDYCAI